MQIRITPKKINVFARSLMLFPLLDTAPVRFAEIAAMRTG
jgi:hypothetical protein